MSVDFDPSDVIRIAPHFKLQWEEAQQAHVLLYPEGMVQLNETAAEILTLCAEGCSTQGILDACRELYPMDDVEEDVREFLKGAASNGWICIERT
jgi:pyrroloquinoline quinone biosynthesis protein D